MPVVSGEKLLELFPHRAGNVLIDRADVPLEPGGQKGAGWLSISPQDPRGRDVILYREDGREYILSPFAAEYIALGSICVLAPDLEPGEVCFFSTISNVEFTGRVPAGETLRVEVDRQKDRGPFKRFQGMVLSDASSRKIASAGIMAYALSAGQMSGGREQSAQKSGGKQVEPPSVEDPREIGEDLFAFKKPSMVFAGEIVNSSGNSLTTRYAYPPDHPFCEGHFPGNPVMMGVTQWQMAEDALTLLARETGLEGEAAASAEVIRSAGELVAELKGLRMDFSSAVPRTLSVKKVAFRDMVRPGEDIFCRVSLEQQ